MMKFIGTITKILKLLIRIKRRLPFWLSSRANLFVAFATFVLAIVTTFMAIGTWKLADITVEQFKIKSYPTFFVEMDEIKVETDSIFHNFKITNKGEISAHKVTLLLIYIYIIDDTPVFRTQLGLYYEGEQKMMAHSFEKKIFSNTSLNINNFGKVPIDYSIQNLKYALLFIKFKVPYDTIYRYEDYGYILKNIPNTKEYFFEEISYQDRNNLINSFMNKTGEWPEYKKFFFNDYNTDSYINNQ